MINANQNGAILHYLEGTHIQVTTKHFEVWFSCMQEMSSWPRDSGLKTCSSNCHCCFSSIRVLKHNIIKIRAIQVIKEKCSWFLSFPILLPNTYHALVVFFGVRRCTPKNFVSYSPDPKKFDEEDLRRAITWQNHKTDYETDKNWHWSISCHWPRSIPPEYIRKPLIFWRSLGVWKETSRMKYVNHVLLFWRLIIFFI